MLGITTPLRVNAETLLAPGALARLASESVDKFCHSADPEVTTRHVPDLEGIARRRWGRYGAKSCRYRPGQLWEEARTRTASTPTPKTT